MLTPQALLHPVMEIALHLWGSDQGFDTRRRISRFKKPPLATGKIGAVIAGGRRLPRPWRELALPLLIADTPPGSLRVPRARRPPRERSWRGMSARTGTRLPAISRVLP